MNPVIPVHPVIPAQRNPRPTLAGSVNNTPLSRMLGTASGVPLGTPRVGTAWNLGGLTVGMSVQEAATPGTDFAKIVLGLVLDGREIDTFEFEWNANTRPNDPNDRLAIYKPYLPGFTVYDTSTLALIEHFASAEGSPYAFFNVNLDWRGNVSYT